MRAINALLCALALGTLYWVGGCAQLGLAPAQSLDERLAYANGVYQAIETSTAAAVTAGTLSKADGRTVLNLSDNARSLLDAAQSVESAGDATAAQQRLVLATAVLTQVQTFLSQRGVR